MKTERYPRARRNNVRRYRWLLQTELTELERQYIERRLNEEKSAMETLRHRPSHFKIPTTLLVCENHPDTPWDGEHACTCGAAGMPCPQCNPSDLDHPPRPPAGTHIEFDEKGWRH